MGPGRHREKCSVGCGPARARVCRRAAHRPAPRHSFDHVPSYVIELETPRRKGRRPNELESAKRSAHRDERQSSRPVERAVIFPNPPQPATCQSGISLQRVSPAVKLRGSCEVPAALDATSSMALDATSAMAGVRGARTSTDSRRMSLNVHGPGLVFRSRKACTRSNRLVRLWTGRCSSTCGSSAPTSAARARNRRSAAMGSARSAGAV
jgi:hypothetical protein